MADELYTVLGTVLGAVPGKSGQLYWSVIRLVGSSRASTLGNTLPKLPA